MVAKEFIYNGLHKLSIDFPSVSIKYCFNTMAKTHIVELTPEKLYYEDKGLESAWLDLVVKFMELF
ncbi:MAG TPA: hypothetical protein VKR58_00275, partial [Aquella sp.]|nr:hypothetical protein [Aquella sp.]